MERIRFTKEQLKGLIDEYQVDAQWIHQHVLQLTPQEWSDLSDDKQGISLKEAKGVLAYHQSLPASI